ncbi:polysaccharide deacetylase family protein [Kroppenstedtia eburnea]|uniref:Probable sporulation protein, polysaccharide deacetylase family n=1 Tax=Kroppenstedtia eburnea TaxID=714067 RepID=A0A1N7IV55_9BACL|nr:polysaccharide deacetylase family protein [Kroppenstedtia eburnea]QKI82230.1 polysaccharide deacetylase family protein [Kroppenstedtia eburnea]SIS40972.1 probable sporulation protein, polysaccharide deacetylase family [Kroppenstedtia eburnea]
MKRRLRKRWVLLAVPLIWLGVWSPSVTAYVTSVKKGTAEPVLKKEDGKLREVIEKGSRARRDPPVDARIDRIWKAIPGYNGLEVDKEATYRSAIKGGKEKPVTWVFREIPAKVSLDQLPVEPIYRGNEKKPMAALMINVAWGTEHLSRMLDILEKEGVAATFFLDGSWLNQHPEEAKKLLAKGHELGNHGYSHPLMSRVSRERIRSEMEKTETLIRKLGVESRFFAPPAGDFNRVVLEEARRMGMKTVLWTVDTVDWRKTSSPEWMTQRIRKGIGKGSLVLMHPTDRTVQALPQIIGVIKEKGLRLGTVKEVLSPKRVEVVEPVPSF